MKALVYHQSIPRYLLCGLLSKIWRRRFFPTLAPFGLRNVAFAPPSPDWVQLKVLMCGICGSDLNLLRGAESVLLEPYGSFPAIMGHEVLAQVMDAPDNSGFRAGERVVVEPVLPCNVRGLPPCRSCQRGDYNLCERFTEGDLAPGVVMGFNQSAGGGMAEFMSAHPSRLIRVPDKLSDDTAVLTDSLASALQPAMDNFPQDDEVVVIFGMGIIGQHLLRSLRSLGSRATIIAVARHPLQQELAKKGGANEVLMSANREQLSQAVGGRLLKTTLGGGNVEGGADIFFDCVGSSGSVQEGLLALRAKGVYVMVGTAGKLSDVDFSSLWFRSLTMTGTNCYAHGMYQGKRVRTYDLAVKLLASGAYNHEGLLTHTFPLEDWSEAFRVAFDKKRRQSMKVAIDLRLSEG